jgi:hypothetical protein
VIFPGIYNVSNGFTVIWLFGQFRWLSCNKRALLSDCKSEYYHILLCVAGTITRRDTPDFVLAVELL